ncbi:hypothetical protein ACQPXM_10820 [Kribbella sp. CA-253562]|uniref:hypothetical protein n=1 Tax=Kribbella sp. CA-253562 TaxID=3239942 RepID=UPI003D925C8A
MTIERVLGRTAYDVSGARIGPIVTLHSCTPSGEIAWATVARGITGAQYALVPLTGARVSEDGVHLKVEKALIKQAPQIEVDGALSESELARLAHHYGLTADQSTTPREVRPRRSTAYARLGSTRRRPAARPGQRRSREAEPRPVTVRHDVQLRPPRHTADGLIGRMRAFLRRWLRFGR